MSMLKVTGKEQVTVEREFEFDRRIYSDTLLSWKIADIILEGWLRSKIEDVESGDAKRIVFAADEINDAFKKADAILAL